MQRLVERDPPAVRGADRVGSVGAELAEHLVQPGRAGSRQSQFRAAGRTITSAIPPVFEAYATVVLPERGEGQDAHDQAVLELLSAQPPDQLWWLGYLAPAGGGGKVSEH